MMKVKYKEKGHLILLILLILLGSFLRFYHLDYNSLWYDEAFTLFTANHSLPGIWDIVANNAPDLANVVLAGEFNPPLFYYLEHFMLVFGQSEFVLRFIPAFLGVLTIPVFYSIGKEFADEDIGIIMAALLSFSPFHVFFSQEARAFSMMLFIFSLAFFFFLVSLRTNSVPSWIVFGFLSGVTVWTHFYAIIPLALLFAYALFWQIAQGRNDRHQLRLYSLSVFTFILVCIPLVPLTISLFLKRTSLPPTWGTKGFDVVYQIFRALSEYHPAVMALFLILFVIGTFFLWKTDKAKAILIVGLLTIPILISIALAEKIPMDKRYLLYVLPFFFLGISLSLKPSAGLVKGRNVLIPLIIIFFLVQAPFLAYYYIPYSTQYSKEDWRGIAKSIEQNSAEGDYIIVIPYYTRLPLDLYYNNRSDGTYEFGVRNESEILPLLNTIKNNRAYFVVTWHITAVDPDGSTMQWLHNNTQSIGMTNEIELYALNMSK